MESDNPSDKEQIKDNLSIVKKYEEDIKNSDNEEKIGKKQTQNIVIMI